MERKEMIAKLKNNEKPLGLLTEEEQNFLRRLPRDAEIYSGKKWRGEIDGGLSFTAFDSAYRLRPDYTEPDEVERCEVFISCGDLAYRRKNCANNAIHCALFDPDFIDYLDKDGYSMNGMPRKIMRSGLVEPAEHPKYVLFRRKHG